MKYSYIFDCDGVLVDSEYLASKIDADSFNAIGYPITHEETIKKFTGINDRETRQLILQETGIDITENFSLEQETKILKDFEKNLQPLMREVISFLQLHKAKMCVASGSSRPRVIKSLEITNQLGFFGTDNIFTSSQVAKGKPAPDLFLFAAKQMEIVPQQSIVIEDSVPGIEAALAADMKVIGFLGGNHTKYHWYHQNILKYNIPIAYNEAELLEIIKKKELL